MKIFLLLCYNKKNVCLKKGIKMNAYLKSILGKQGILAQNIPYYEYRKEQLAMSQLIGHCLLNSKHAVIEAGTGIGKSFAYLIPAIQYSLQKNKKIVISTKTINLQEQILKKDIPLLKKTLAQEFQIVLAKGRNNYLCLKKLEQYSQLNLVNTQEQNDLNKLHLQSIQAKQGDKEEFSCSSELWEKICCDSDSCLKKSCPKIEKCFFYQAKKKQETADILLVNHALFFADLAIRRNNNNETNSGILSDYDSIIFDEAHHLENIATQFLGIKLNYFDFKYLIDQINLQINSRSPLGQIIGINNKIFEKFQLFLREFNEKALKFFQQAYDYLADETTYRLKTGENFFLEDSLSAYLTTVIQEIDMIKDSYPLSDEYLTSLANLTCKANLIKNSLKFFLEQSSKEEYVYWIEKNMAKDSKLKNVILSAAPISIAKTLAEILFKQNSSVILTSATLAVNDDFKYFTERIGLKERCYQPLQLKAPFDYQSQALLYLPSEAPDPRSKQFNGYLIKTIKQLVEISQGRAFILFTSYKAMNYIYQHLQKDFAAKGFQTFIQGEKRRDLLLQEFKNNLNSVLFGTDSFWEGVDVQGEALSCVIIVKLPFVVPNHPVIQARCEYLEKIKKNPFIEYSLPQAVLKLKQGFGRLIRSKTDQGIVAILDKRITQAFYGKQFLESLPPAKITHSIEDLEKFF